MILKEINNTVTLVWGHTIARISCLVVFFCALLLSLFFSLFSSVVIIVSYLSGFVVCFFLTKYRNEVELFLQRLIKLYHGHLTPKKTRLNSCNICDKSNCNRHKTSQEPWKGLLINKDLNQAIENFYNKILNNFITSWYVNYTDDSTFVDELRTSLRFATANILLRYLEIDVGNVIANKMVPCAVKHIDDCLQIQEKAERGSVKIEQAAISHLGRKMHVCVTNRDNEIEYLRHLTSNILPHILSKYNLKCTNFNTLIREILASWVFLPLMDVIADPNIINLLVNITFSYKKKPTLYKSLDRVEILHNFSNYKNVKQAALGSDLSRVFKDQELFYSFLQFVKDQGPISLLQFCRNVEDFNLKLLTPELSKLELDVLHKEATQIFHLYLQETSSDFIGCPSHISFSVEKLLNAGPNGIPKFRTSTPLYKAYDYAFNILEIEWLPVFFHSDEFYQFACGSKISSNYRKSPATKFCTPPPGSPFKIRSAKKSEATNQGTVSKLSSGFTKIKGALRTQPIEGAVFQSEAPNFESDTSLFIEQNINRDLSCWRVSINQVEQGLANSKPVAVFYINVKRIDSCLESERYWTVHRYDQDFHTLKIKLIEFHGENEICDSPLPSRRSTTPIETRRQKYEEFVQKLLQKPSLRGSDLLYTFLTTKQNFTILADTSVPIVSDLENIYQSVAHKLRKEKGQRLDPFMATFLASTETGQLKLKYESPDVGEEANLDDPTNAKINKPRNFKNSIFQNNFDISFPSNIVYTPSSYNPQNVIDSAFYLLKNIFQVPPTVLKLYNSVCYMAAQTVNYFTCACIEKGLNFLLPPHTLAQLITLLQDVLFGEKTPPPSKLELEERKLAAINNFSCMHTGAVGQITGVTLNKGFVTLLNILQNPTLNKQNTAQTKLEKGARRMREHFTENDRGNNNAVIPTDHTNKGIRSKVIPTGRMLIIVVIKCTAPKIEEIPAKLAYSLLDILLLELFPDCNFNDNI